MVKTKFISLLIFFFICFSVSANVPLQIGTIANKSSLKIVHIGDFVRTELERQVVAIGRFDLSSSNAWLLNAAISKMNVNAGGVSSFGIGGYHSLDTSVDMDLRVTRSGTNFFISDHASKRETDTELIIKNKDRTESMRDTADKMIRMDAMSPGFRDSMLGQTVQSLVEKLAWKLSLKLLGQAFGYRTEISDARDGFIIIKNDHEAGFKNGQEFFVRSAIYTDGSLAEKKNATIKAVMNDRLEITVPGHLFKSGDEVILY